MPYIKQDRREDLDKALYTLLCELGECSPGDCAYVFTRIMQQIMGIKGKSYQTFAIITGIIDTVRHEFLRRVVNPYENKKKRQNGDVF